MADRRKIRARRFCLGNSSVVEQIFTAFSAKKRAPDVMSEAWVIILAGYLPDLREVVFQVACRPPAGLLRYW